MKNFIPKQSKTEAITIRVSTDKLEIIDSSSAKYDISRNAFINQCIDFALENMISENKE